MKTALAIFSVWLLIISAAVPVRPQENVSCLDRIEGSIRRKKPDWKAVNRRVSRNKKYGAFRWGSGKSFVNVLIFVHDSQKEVVRTYQGLRYDFEALGLDMKILEATVPHLGDENYVWEDSNDRKTTGIDFRKGNVFVHITAPTIGVAKQFALLIAEDLPAT